MSSNGKWNRLDRSEKETYYGKWEELKWKCSIKELEWCGYKFDGTGKEFNITVKGLELSEKEPILFWAEKELWKLTI